VPAGREPLVVIAPLADTRTWPECDDVDSVYVSVPLTPAVTSWLAKAADAVVVVVPVVGGDWVIVTAVTVSVKIHVPESAEVSASPPLTAYVPAGRVPLVVIAPLGDTRTWPECEDVDSV
jgi:hypothetical protein